MAGREGERLLTVKELAELCQVSVETVYYWRVKGYGPQGIRVGKHVRFRPSVVEAWLDDQTEPEPARPAW